MGPLHGTHVVYGTVRCLPPQAAKRKQEYQFVNLRSRLAGSLVSQLRLEEQAGWLETAVSNNIYESLFTAYR